MPFKARGLGRLPHRGRERDSGPFERCVHKPVRLLGLGLGIALQRGLRSQGLNTLGIPWVLVVVMLLASVVVGILAAALPSMRAIRLDILDAMAHV